MQSFWKNLIRTVLKSAPPKKQHDNISENLTKPIGVWQNCSKKNTLLFFQNKRTRVLTSTIYAITNKPETVLIYNKHKAIILPCVYSISIIQKNPTDLLVTINLTKPDSQNNTVYLATAKINNPYRLNIICKQNSPGIAHAVPPYKKFSSYIFYAEHTYINALTFSKDTTNHIGARQLDTREELIYHIDTTIVAAIPHARGSLLVLQDKNTADTTKLIACVMAHDYPAHMHHQSKIPIANIATSAPVTIFGHTQNKQANTITLWARTNKNQIQILTIPHPLENIAPTNSVASLTKARNNPIISPRAFYPWESHATFNPAAFIDQDRIHLLYRTEGNLGKSVLGYAYSDDGLNFDRLAYPVFIPKVAANREKSYYPQNTTVAYRSNSGHHLACPTNTKQEQKEQHRYEVEHGCEDPRVTIIDDTIYLFYQAYDGRHYARIAYVTLSLEDFRQQKWNWSTPHLCAPQSYRWGDGTKAGAILPNKVNGKFAIFHRHFPNIHIDYIDNLEFSEETKWLQTKDTINYNGLGWDSHKISIGANPIEITEGYLLITVGTGWQDNHSRYQVGAMIVDKQDPAKVLYRSHGAVLVPQKDYEHNGHKWGVAYPCGAVVKNGTLFVYYGASDKYTCVATANLQDFVNKLKQEPVQKIQWQKI